MKIATQIFLGFLVAVLIDSLDSYVNYRLTLKVNANMAFLTNSEAVIRNSARINKGIVSMENAFRGYLLTEDEHYLSGYYSGLNDIPDLIAQEKKLISPGSVQTRELDSIVVLHNLWLSYANSVLMTKKVSPLNINTAHLYRQLLGEQFRDKEGKSYNDRITVLFRSFDKYEYKLREERRIALAASIRQTEQVSMLFSVLMIATSIVVAMYVVKKIISRINSMVNLAENISNGVFTKVEDNKRDELTNLSVSLNMMSDKLSRNIALLEKKNDELNQFAYVVSHDLKAPIRGISNVVQWIHEDLDSELSPGMRKYLDIIPERLLRMEGLIDGLLEYARIGRETQVIEEVDVNILVKELVELIVPKDRKIVIMALPTLWTEKILLQQVFSNLISNAVKYTSSEDGRIEVSSLDKGAFYEFTVSDNGPGISKEYHEKIFEIFQTLREKNDKESTGIGLAIVKKILEEKQSSIRLVSSQGAGAAFTFTWPKN